MARKNYTQEFRRQAVDLYRSTPGATLRGIAADLGISRGTLQVWVHALDPDPLNPSSAPLSAPCSAPVSAPLPKPAERPGSRSGRPGSAAAELAALRARVAALETENVKLETERDILRQAAKYFAGETHW
jgi:transposase